MLRRECFLPLMSFVAVTHNLTTTGVPLAVMFRGGHATLHTDGVCDCVAVALLWVIDCREFRDIDDDAHHRPHVIMLSGCTEWQRLLMALVRAWPMETLGFRWRLGCPKWSCLLGCVDYHLILGRSLSLFLETVPCRWVLIPVAEVFRVNGRGRGTGKHVASTHEVCNFGPPTKSRLVISHPCSSITIPRH